MRNPKFSKEEVIAAGIELQKQNKTVTGNAIALALGGGRPDRFKSIWEEYLMSQQERANNEVAEYHLSPDLEDEFYNLSDSLIKNIKSILIDCEKRMNQQATARIEHEQLICNERVLAMEESLKDANSLINKQEDKIEYLLSKQLAFKEEQSTISELEKQQAILTNKIDSLNESLKDKDRLILEQKARIEDLVNFESLLAKQSITT